MRTWASRIASRRRSRGASSSRIRSPDATATSTGWSGGRCRAGHGRPATPRRRGGTSACRRTGLVVLVVRRQPRRPAAERGGARGVRRSRAGARAARRPASGRGAGLRRACRAHAAARVQAARVHGRVRRGARRCRSRGLPGRRRGLGDRRRRQAGAARSLPARDGGAPDEERPLLRARGWSGPRPRGRARPARPGDGASRRRATADPDGRRDAGGRASGRRGGSRDGADRARARTRRGGTS